ncbi:MAG: hypothetical protein IKG69_01980 [Atopobiaceae bacterium]|nr:hypothetical protein [Atopobiaceae bacterium]
MVVRMAAEALTSITRASGKSLSAKSTNLGHAMNYVSVFVSRKQDIQTSTMARIARECGFTLALVPDGSAALEDESVVVILPEAN